MLREDERSPNSLFLSSILKPVAFLSELRERLFEQSFGLAAFLFLGAGKEFKLQNPVAPAEYVMDIEGSPFEKRYRLIHPPRSKGIADFSRADLPNRSTHEQTLRIHGRHCFLNLAVGVPQEKSIEFSAPDGEVAGKGE